MTVRTEYIESLSNRYDVKRCNAITVATIITGRWLQTNWRGLLPRFSARCIRIILIVAAHIFFGRSHVLGQDAEPQIVRAVKDHCLDCHDSQSAESGLDLAALKYDPNDHASFALWVKVYNRVQRREMPPADSVTTIEPAVRQSFLDSLARDLATANARRQRSEGRTQYRRLSRTQYENSMRRLLALPELSVADMLPEDTPSDGFDNIGSALNLSEIQIARYLDAADHALDQAIVLTDRPEILTTRLIASQNGRFRQVLGKQQEAVNVDGAVGLLRQPNTAQAPWFWSKFEPPVDGYYRIRMKTFGFHWDAGTVRPPNQNHVVTFHAVQGSTKRALTSLDVPASRGADAIEFEGFLRVGDQIQIWFETLDDRNKPGRLPITDYRAPGVAVEWLEVHGPISPAGLPASYVSLFGDLPVEPYHLDSGLLQPPIPIITEGVGKRAVRVPAKPKRVQFMRVVPRDPTEDARSLLHQFAQRAFRRPVEPIEIEDILRLVQTKIDQRHCFQEAMRIGYQAILCSPEFLFLDESPGKLSDHALASRLSFFLWNEMPDEKLLELASQSNLTRPEVLRNQVDRLID
ncbi:MAG: DUF1587 domain-containing protein, partial [Planctomycetales bacterium]|nr:DUF1587 domain-containing protein [Planctomycetales bacterium]